MSFDFPGLAGGPLPAASTERACHERQTPVNCAAAKQRVRATSAPERLCGLCQTELGRREGAANGAGSLRCLCRGCARRQARSTIARRIANPVWCATEARLGPCLGPLHKSRLPARDCAQAGCCLRAKARLFARKSDSSRRETLLDRKGRRGLAIHGIQCLVRGRPLNSLDARNRNSVPARSGSSPARRPPQRPRS